MLAATILVLVAVGAMVLVAWLADFFFGDDWDERGAFRLWPACAKPYYFVRVDGNAQSMHGTKWEICVSTGGSRRHTEVLVSIPSFLTYYVMLCADVESEVRYANGRTDHSRTRKEHRKNRELLIRNINWLKDERIKADQNETLRPEFQQQANEWLAEVSDTPPGEPPSIRDVYLAEAIEAELLRQREAEQRAGGRR